MQYPPKYGRPNVERIENLPVTIVLDQKNPLPVHVPLFSLKNI